MSDNNYDLVRASLSLADDALAIFKIGLSPTSLEAIAKHIAKHAIAMSMSKPDPMNLIGAIAGLALKLTCEKEVKAFLKAEEAADAEKD